MTTFSHFCPEHIGMLLVIAAAVTIGLLILRRSPEENARKAVIVLSVALFSGEALQDIFLLSEGRNYLDLLPLHLCNLGIFVNLLAAFTRGKIRSFFAEISLVLIMPGAVSALLFPDWTYKPFWSYLPMLCFFTHTLLVFIPLVFLVRKTVRVSFKHFWYPCLFLALTVPPIYILNQRTGENYMFLMYPPESSPLEWIHNLTGDTYYIAGLAGLILLIIMLEYGFYSLVNFLNRK